MKIVKPFKLIRQDACPVCSRERSLEAYSRYGKALSYSLTLDYNLNIANVAYLECKRCKAKFFPLYREISNYPYPMEEEDYGKFMDNYILSYRKTESN